MCQEQKHDEANELSAERFCKYCDAPIDSDPEEECDYCKNCMDAMICKNCDHEIHLDEAEDDGLCPSCRKREERQQWVHDTKETVMELAKKHGWDFDRFGWHRSQTSSEYLQIDRHCRHCAPDEDGDDGCDRCGYTGSRVLTIRVSDHATCYAREDISLAMNPSGDDHTMAHLEKVLCDEDA